MIIYLRLYFVRNSLTTKNSVIFISLQSHSVAISEWNSWGKYFIIRELHIFRLLSCIGRVEVFLISKI